MCVAKLKKDVQCGKGKRSNVFDAIAEYVMSEAFDPLTDGGRAYIRYVAEELMKLPVFKTDLVIRMASFNY